MKKMMNYTISTDENYAALITRVFLAIVLFAHGAQSMVGWFGGPGFTSTMLYLTLAMKLPYLIALSVISLQFFGAILLLFGLLTRPISLAIAGMFIGMVLTVHLDHGFFMNWFGTNKGEGYEYHLLVLALCFTLMIQGGGKASIDRVLTTRKTI